MNQIATFEKISFEQYLADRRKMTESDDIAAIRREWEEIKLPLRATAGSAGYDFFIPVPICLDRKPVTVPTGIRCKIDPGWFLMCCPKSGLGFKYRMRLANTIGVVDSDYYFSTNEGHILAKISSKEPFHLEAGAKFMQGIFLSFGITTDDDATAVRNGGFGSTGA